MKPSQNELQDKTRKAMTTDREKVLGTIFIQYKELLFNSVFILITFYYYFSFLIIVVEKKKSILAMAEKQQKMEDSNQTVTSQVKEKEEITTTQTEGSRCFFCKHYMTF